MHKNHHHKQFESLVVQSHAEAKLESLEDQLRRLRAQVDDLTRANNDLAGVKAKQAQDIHDLQRQLQELDSSNAHLTKAKAQLQALLDEAKARLEDESRVRVNKTMSSKSLSYSS